MKKKKRIIIITISIILLFIIIYILYDKVYLNKVSNVDISLNGNNEVILNLYDNYEEEGAHANFRDINLNDDIEISSNIDNTKVGKYEVTYKVNYKFKYKDIKRIVKVIDNIAPELTLNGENEVEVYQNSPFYDQGAKAIDNYDGDISDQISVEGDIDTSKIGKYEIFYSITDFSGNKSEIKRTVNVVEVPLNHKKGIAVLNYHFFFGDDESCDSANCISTSKFESHLKYLKDNNYKTLTMEEFRAWMYKEIELPDKSVLITIDDGALGTGKHNGNKLIPLLEKYEAHATLFLITGWWDISNYESKYLDIESHSNDMHTEKYCKGVSRGAKMLCLDKEDVINDLKQSMAITKSNKAFCYPFFVYNSNVIEYLKEVGFQLAFAGGGYKATRNSNKYAIPRFQILQNITLEQFISYIY